MKRVQRKQNGCMFLNHSRGQHFDPKKLSADCLKMRVPTVKNNDGTKALARITLKSSHRLQKTIENVFYIIKRSEVMEGGGGLSLIVITFKSPFP